MNAPNAGKTRVRAEVENDQNAAIVAIEQTLGTNPQGTKADVKTYLQTQHGTDGTHTWLPSGTNMVFYNASAPTGWTQVTSQNDKALRVVSGVGGGAGGSHGFSAFPANAGAESSHTHTNSTHTHSVPFSGWISGGTAGAGKIIVYETSVPSGLTTAQSDHVSGSGGGASTGAGSSHNHSLGISPQYIDVIIATRA